MKSKYSSLIPILVEDKNIGGYTAYFKEYPDVLAEGNNKAQAIDNLINTLNNVLKFKKENQNK